MKRRPPFVLTKSEVSLVGADLANGLNVTQVSARGNALTIKWLLRIVLIVIWISSTADCLAADSKRVLILASEDPYVPAITTINREIRASLANSPERIEFSYEALADARVPHDRYQSEFVELVKKKYGGQPFHLTFLLGTPAVRFYLENKQALFPTTPAIFIVEDARTLEGLDLSSDITGVSGSLQINKTLDLALALQPNTKRVVVVSGVAPRDRALTEIARMQLSGYQGLEFQYLTDLPVRQVKEVLSSLPPKTIVIHLGMMADSAGNRFAGVESLGLVVPTANAPVYSYNQVALGQGIVGGSLSSFESLGKRLGELGLRVLKGERPEAIPRETLPAVPILDWRQLRRWDIAEANIPLGSEIRFKELTFWQQYKWRIVGVLSLCVVEALLIVFLLIQRVRRRQAERGKEQFAKLVQAQHRRLDEVVSNVPGLVWETRIDSASGKTKTEFLSRYVEKMLGYTQEDFPGFALDLVAPEDRERVAREINAIMSNRLPGVMQFRSLTKDGRSIWVEAHLAVVTDENGEALGLRGVTMDITDRIKAEESLKESEQRLRLGLQAGRMIAWDWDPADDKLNIVGELSKIYGIDSDSQQQRGFALLHPDDWPQYQPIVQNALEDGRNYQSEFRIVRPDNGAVVWIEERGEAVNRNVGAAKLTGVMVDITERRKAEEALRASEARFRILADSAPVMIWMSGTDKLCTFFNQGWLTFTGRTMEQELGSGWADSVHPNDYAGCLDAYASAFDLRESFQIEYRLRRADGVFRWIYDCGTPRFSSEGEFLGYIGSCIDISDRKEAEHALQTANQELSRLKDQLEVENLYLQEEIKLAHNIEEIVGQSDAIKYVLYKIEQVAKTDSTVLILGETGTGKELVARALHNQSLRKDRPLVKVNCAALSPTLIESDLFGHEKGAFTGAAARKSGRFEIADGATIFLDEIGELPPDLQAKLLRVVQEGEFERLGGTKTIKVDVRILAATNRNLKSEVEKGRFREDLWYRLNVFPITVPPLRHRREDIPEMVEHFVSIFSKKIGRNISTVSGAMLNKLQVHTWPGNVRELANVIERAVINSRGPVLQLDGQIQQHELEIENYKSLEDMEKEYILSSLDETGWRIEGPKGAATRLGLHPSTLRTKMIRLGIQRAHKAASGQPQSS